MSKPAATPDAIAMLAGLVAIARSQLGVAESPKGSNRGPALDKFFASDDYKPGKKRDGGYPWCASFVCWCIQQWLIGEVAKRFRVKAPRTPSAFGLITWAQKQRAMQIITRHELITKRYRTAPGDIVVFEVSHVGICSKPQLDQFVTTIDGNTNDDGSREGYEVAEKTRLTSDVRAVLRFIPSAVTV